MPGGAGGSRVWGMRGWDRMQRSIRLSIELAPRRVDRGIVNYYSRIFGPPELLELLGYRVLRIPDL